MIHRTPREEQGPHGGRSKTVRKPGEERGREEISCSINSEAGLELSQSRKG